MQTGSGEKIKFVRVTLGTTAPAGPARYDIWINTSDTNLNQVYFYENQPALGNNDVMIGIGAKKEIFKLNIDKGNKHTTLPISSGTGQRFLQTTFFDIYGIYTVAKKNISGTVQILPAYYWNGSTWVQFSFVDDYVLMRIRNPNDSYRLNMVRASDMVQRGEVNPASDFWYRYLSFDVERNLLMFGHPSNSTITETDVFFNVIRTVQFNTAINTTVGFIFNKGGRYYQIRSGGSDSAFKVLIYDITGTSNNLIYTSTSPLSGYRLGVGGFFGAVDETKNYLYVYAGENGNTRPTSYCFIINISNMSAITDSVVNVGLACMAGLFIGKNFILLGGADGDKAVINEKSIDNTVLLKQVRTSLSSDMGSYNTRYPMGKDSEGCYYVSRLSSAGGYRSIDVQKIAPNGSIIFTVAWNVERPATFTPGQRLASLTGGTGAGLSLLSNIDGSIVATYVFDVGYIDSLVCLGAGNFPINRLR